jgi:hypothetical protein
MITHRDVMNSLPKRRRRAIEASGANSRDGRESARRSPSSGSVDHRQRGNLEEALPQPDRRIQLSEGTRLTGLPPRRQKSLLRLSLDEHTDLVTVFSPGPYGDRIHTGKTCKVL